MALLPNFPAKISQYWIDRGLVFLSLGNGPFWTIDRGWVGSALFVGGPKKPAGKFGKSLGFGTTYGTGSTDRVDGPTWTTSTGFRSIVAFCYANGFGGNGSGRIFNAAGTSGVVAQDESLFVSNAASREMTYTHIATSTVGQWYWSGSGTGIELNVWKCFSLTHDCRSSGISPIFYKNGILVGTGVVSQTATAYVRTTAVMNVGNRSSDGARGFDGMHGPLMIFDHPSLGLTAKEHADLTLNPSLLFQPPRRSYLFAPPTSGDITGTLAATESGIDTAASTGTVLVQGTLAATESGQDTAAFSGSSAVTGTLAATESGNDTFASSGDVIVQGTLAASESGADTFSAVGPTYIIDDDYERSSINVSLSSVSGSGDSATISLTPRQVENETVGGLRWMEPSARITNVDGKRPTFRFLDYASGELHGYPFTSSKRMSFSYDQLTWFYFDTTTLVAGSYVEFRHNTAFTENVVYITRGRQVSPRQWGQFCEDIATDFSSFAGPTASAASFTPTLTTWPGQSLIAGEFSTQTDELSRTVSQTPLYALRINDTSLTPYISPKRIVQISTGIHAGEDLAEIALMRAIEHLCGSSAEAIKVRRNCDIRIYGLINAPGRQGGSWRSGFTQGTSGADDAARHFSDVGGAGLETVTIPRTAMLADLGSDIPDILLDMHGTYINTWSTFKDTGNAKETLFHNRLAANSGFTVVDEGDHTAGTIAYWGAVTLGITGVSLTIEHGDEIPQSDANYVTWGAAIIKSIADMYTGGQLAVAESGSDTAAITGDVIVTGSLAATETGSDVFAGDGTGVLNGSVTETMEMDVTFSASVIYQTSITETLLSGIQSNAQTVIGADISESLLMDSSFVVVGGITPTDATARMFTIPAEDRTFTI